MSLDLYLQCRGCEQAFWTRNITHNLLSMWQAAGVRAALYESGGKTGADVRAAVADGLTTMKQDPRRFQALNPANGWGSYDSAIEFLEAFLSACDEWPHGVIRVSR